MNKQMVNRQLKCFIYVSLCAGLLAACGPVQSGRWYDRERWREPADVFFGKESSQKQAQETANARASQQASQQTSQQTSMRDIIQVRAGDNYYKIARRYGVSPRALIEANQAQPPYNLQQGQDLILPTNQSVVIEKGDTLYSLSRQYGVDVRSLAWHNNLSAPYHLAVGQTLYLPASGKRQQVQTAQIGQAGQKAQAKRATKQTALPPTPARKGQFINPVQGQGEIISTYGGKENGLHNDGINIAVPLGTEVKAAETGVVVYAGNNLENYGNLILIRHSGGYVTAYAHNSVLLAKAGDKVTQGQVIAESGSTGNITTPQVHFEIRKGKLALDPQKLIES